MEQYLWVLKEGGSSGRMKEHQKTTGGTKRDASSQAQGSWRQAKRDAR
jgi:hypothetical protein